MRGALPYIEKNMLLIERGAAVSKNRLPRPRSTAIGLKNRKNVLLRWAVLLRQAGILISANGTISLPYFNELTFCWSNMVLEGVEGNGVTSPALPPPRGRC